MCKSETTVEKVTDMSSQSNAFLSLSGHSTTPFLTQQGVKVLLLLVGMAFCLQVLDSPTELKAFVSIQDPVEPILLHSSDSILLQSEVAYPRIQGDSSTVFQRITNDKHLWAYLQTVKVGELSGLVYFFRFRDDAGARECVNVIRTSVEFMTSFEGRQFGSYAVLAIASSPSEDSSPLFEKVFEQIAQNMES